MLTFRNINRKYKNCEGKLPTNRQIHQNNIEKKKMSRRINLRDKFPSSQQNEDVCKCDTNNNLLCLRSFFPPNNEQIDSITIPINSKFSPNFSFICTINIADNKILVELLEVLIQSILYERKVFPNGIYRQFKVYNTAVNASILPAIKEYIALGSKYLLCLLANNYLHRFHLIIYNDDDERQPKPPIERFVFDFYDNDRPRRKILHANDRVLMRFEEDARRTLLLLNQQLKHFRPLSGLNTTFKYLFETTDLNIFEMDGSSNVDEKEVRKLPFEKKI